MSTFPKRLIDELDQSPARRLLESAKTDTPPRRVVAAAILAAGATAPAGGAPAPQRPGLRGWTRRKLALVGASIVVVGAVLTSAAIYESPSSRAPVPVAPQAALTVETPVLAPLLAPPATADSVAVTSVFDLPDAPIASAPAPAARPSAPVARDLPAMPADLLREANRLRGDGRWDDAAATYRRVMDNGPASAEAYPAEVALANIDLQQGRASAALTHYEHALATRPSGALAEEARWGKARALRAAGRTAEERAALEDFRTRHPDSPLVPIASRRIAEIGN